MAKEKRREEQARGVNGKENVNERERERKKLDFNLEQTNFVHKKFDNIWVLFQIELTNGRGESVSVSVTLSPTYFAS